MQVPEAEYIRGRQMATKALDRNSKRIPGLIKHMNNELSYDPEFNKMLNDEGFKRLLASADDELREVLASQELVTNPELFQDYMYKYAEKILSWAKYYNPEKNSDIIVTKFLGYITSERIKTAADDALKEIVAGEEQDSGTHTFINGKELLPPGHYKDSKGKDKYSAGVISNRK